MKISRRLFVSASVSASALTALGVGTARAADMAPVVVELFTSQGCSSCPPADALLGELAEREDVIALSCHVDYWNYIGWEDPFSSPQMSERQRAYARYRGERTIFTPQMLIDGQHSVVGSRRGEVQQRIEKAMMDPQPRVPVRIGGGGEVTVGALNDGQERSATVWYVAFDRKHETDISRGENAGRRIAYHGVVREWSRLAAWSGSPLDLQVDLADARERGRGGVAVIVQQDGVGPVLGAAQMRFN